MTGWCAEWSTSLVAIDPHSPSATLLDPLRDAVGKHRVRPVDTIGMAVAHGRFQDRLTAGRLRVRGHTALDLAARQAQERRLAGAQAVDRYQGQRSGRAGRRRTGGVAAGRSQLRHYELGLVAERGRS